MLTATADHLITFQVDVKSVESVKNDKNWSAYEADFKDVFCTEDECDCVFIEGTAADEVPFWAMKPFYDALGKAKGQWKSANFVRTANGKKNTADIEAV